MASILNIETATNVCSVAISSDSKIIFEKINITGPSHATLLGVFVDEAMKWIRSQDILLDAVSVSCGPGSYTGLRIGVAEAKGICYGAGIPLIAINTLEIMASKVLDSNFVDNDTLLCPMIDARRMEVYAAIYDNNMNEIRETRADIVENDTYLEYLDRGKVLFFGDGSDKCKEMIVNPKAIFVKDIYPSADSMMRLSEQAFAGGRFEDIAYFEPFYLKDFVATTPKKTIF